MASTSTRSDLRAHFNTGDKPSQQNFYDLIESNVNITDASTINGVVKLAGNTGLTPGSGFGDAALYKSWISNEGTVTITNILID